MRKDPKIFLNDILDSIERIEEYVKECTKKEFLDDYEKQDAVIRRLEIIGEAVNGISNKIQAEYSKIPWRQISGMRNVLIHEYSGVNEERIWDTIKKDIPVLKREVKEMLKDFEY